MDLTTLTALYPIVRDILNRAPQAKGWLEQRAKKEDPIFLMQLHLLESVGELKGGIAELKDGIGELKGGIAELKDGIGELKGGIAELKDGIGELKGGIAELKDGIGELKGGIGDLRGYMLTTAIMSAMLSNPDLSGEQIREKFLKSVEVAGEIQRTIKQISP